MDGELLLPVVDTCTPQRMAQAGVPFELAHWYHLVGRNIRYFFDNADVAKVLTVRKMVLSAGA